MASSIEDVRIAKQKIAKSLTDVTPVNGVGIGWANGGYVVKVNLSEVTDITLPDEMFGVKIVYDVTGTVKKR